MANAEGMPTTAFEIVIAIHADARAIGQFEGNAAMTADVVGTSLLVGAVNGVVPLEAP